MAHLIDKSALIAEIEKAMDEPAPSHDQQCPWEDGYYCGLYKIESIIDTLEVKEVDLEKEVEKYLLTNAAFLIGGDSKLVVHHIAKHFFEIGIQQSKNDNDNEEPQRMVSAKAKEAGYSKLESKDFTFKSIPRILEMVKPSDRAKSYCEKLAKSLENEGYPTDAKIVMESIKMMNGEKVSMATMDEEPVSEDLEEASKEWLRPQLDMSYINYGEGKMMELTHFDGYAMLDAIEFGVKWKEEQMMKNVVLETTIIKDGDGCAEDGNEGEWLAYEDDEVINMPEWCEEGDKVKLILIKRE